MKLTAFLLLLGCLHLSAATTSQTVTLSVREAPLSKVFQLIKKQTGYSVFGNGSLLKQTREVTISVNRMPLTDFLDSLLRDQPIGYRFLDKTNILLVKRAEIPVARETGARSYLPEIPDWEPIKGTVLDEAGNPVEGVSVRIKGSNTGVSTDAKGNFIINAEAGQVLVFTHVSMAQREIKVKEFPANGRILLKPRDATLNDVVVTGYGNIRKESFTGTYTQVTKADILKVSPNNLLAALQTFDPSFRIMQNINMGSNPNVLPEFYIRGQSGFPGLKELDRLESSSVNQFSLKNNPNTPVFIMDGFEVSVEKVYDMDINRISNVTILKDAAATALYGSRASNGVVVIETIQPKPGEFRVNYNGNFGVTAPDLSSYKMMDAQQKLDLENAAQIYLPTIPETDPYYAQTLLTNRWYQQQKLNEILKGVNTYWLSQPLSTMFNQRHNVYVEGGSQGMRVGLELKYDHQNGVMKESFRKRMGVGLTLQYQTRNLQFRNQVFYDDVAADESPYGNFSDYSRLQPYYPMYDENTGKYLKNMPNYFGYTVFNPMYESTAGNFNRMKYREFTDNFTVNWYLSKFLFIRGQLAVDYKDGGTDVFSSPESTKYARGDLFTKGELSQSGTKTLDWNTNLFASYNRNIDANNINLSAGINAMASNQEFMTSTYRGFPSPAYSAPAYAYQIVTKPNWSDNKRRLFGGFATFNYSLNDIYLFDGSFRVDGSSEFGTDRKWAPFWSLGTGINLHNTSFLKGNTSIDMLRVTANIGQTGKSNFSPFMARNTYQMMLDDWYPTGIGASLIYMGNNRLTWEKQVSWNIGAMLSVLKRFTLEFNYYNKETYDLITDVSLPSSSGFTIYRDNIGKVLNKGFEIKTMLNVINGRDFGLILNGNLAHNKNSIVEIAESMKNYNNRIDEYYDGYIDVKTGNTLTFFDLNEKYTRPIMKYEEGSSLTTIYGMQSLGINPANGREVFLKRDGTITYDWNSVDQVPIGNTEPWAQGSFGINARYKRFSFYTTFLYEWGGEQYNNTLVNNVENVNLFYYNADTRVITDRWQKPGDMSPLKALQDRYYITRPTSRFIQQNNFVSLNSLSLSYDFNPKDIKNIKLSMLRTSFILNDLAMFSTIEREMGLDYPYARTFTFTINASF
ncbi:MAG: SusC/RagA family TonB-linked outer membrane protein [Candidatus Pseudobacter hemicellulosilyticus]|uniref:SusC/RagA family TonB-linked outer membrane protein n=1 Tax=Candidatus Pseudobacter hemicellulosilyticus TaxID=3121375 RepID=A0AAJ5WSU9_9BACT|nr:MAG: SusC/RagA family TonB-linked outer membrane protein [Pseudobacter sp.]